MRNYLKVEWRSDRTPRGDGIRSRRSSRELSPSGRRKRRWGVPPRTGEIYPKGVKKWPYLIKNLSKCIILPEIESTLTPNLFFFSGLSRGVCHGAILSEQAHPINRSVRETGCEIRSSVKHSQVQGIVYPDCLDGIERFPVFHTDSRTVRFCPGLHEIEETGLAENGFRIL